ncbi:MAG: DNA polymerase III subunit beta [Candidatus Blackburnbacteria bacterium]|nr:DNA polymerase III subunit beta [Candidatus Blackburnbacteria bacterium]
MKLSILQEDLSSNTTFASKFVSTRAQLPVLSNILLKAENGKLSLSATNLETGIHISTGVKVEVEGSITVPAKILVDLVNHLPAGKVLLETDKDQLKISCNNFSANISGLPATEFPNIPDFLENATFSLKKETLEALTDNVTFSAATDDTRPILTGVNLIVGDKVIAVATDGFRMSYKELDGVSFDAAGSKFLLPARVIEELNKTLGTKTEDVKVAVLEKEGQIIFQSENTILTSRLIDGEYPDYNRVMPKAWTTKTALGRDEFFQAVKATSVFARESASIVRINFNKDGLVLTSESNQYGKEEIQIEAKTEGDETTVAFNYKYLLDFLNSIDGDTVLIETQGPTSPGVFCDPQDPTYKHIIMPVRV